jgi:hypothetical protein
MALIGNYSVLNKSCARFSNGTATAGAYAANTRSNWNNPTQQFAKINNSFPARTSIPEGYNLGEAYTAPRSSGGLASFLSGSGSLTATGINARLSDTAMSGVGTLTASLGAIVQAASTLSGSGDITANLGILSNMTASLAGGGSITANLSALVGLSSSLSGSGSISSDLKGTNSLSASIVIGGTGYLSNDDVSRLSSAVWDETTADHSTAGTTGKALQDAGSAGNPWSALIASNNTPDTFGWFVQKLLTVAKFIGLR